MGAEAGGGGGERGVWVVTQSHGDYSSPWHLTSARQAIATHLMIDLLGPLVRLPPPRLERGVHCALAAPSPHPGNGTRQAGLEQRAGLDVPVVSAAFCAFLLPLLPVQRVAVPRRSCPERSCLAASPHLHLVNAVKHGQRETVPVNDIPLPTLLRKEPAPAREPRRLERARQPVLPFARVREKVLCDPRLSLASWEALG